MMKCLYDRDQAFGGAQLTQLIVRQYGFSQEEAESKKRSGELPEDYESTCFEAFYREHGAGNRPCACSSSSPVRPHNKVDYMMLAGGSAASAGADRSRDAAHQLSLAGCSIRLTAWKLEMGVRLKKMTREAPSYLTSCGLALRRFLQ